MPMCLHTKFCVHSLTSADVKDIWMLAWRSFAINRHLVLFFSSSIFLASTCVFLLNTAVSCRVGVWCCPSEGWYVLCYVIAWCYSRPRTHPYPQRTFYSPTFTQKVIFYSEIAHRLGGNHDGLSGRLFQLYSEGISAYCAYMRRHGGKSSASLILQSLTGVQDMFHPPWVIWVHNQLVNVCCSSHKNKSPQHDCANRSRQQSGHLERRILCKIPGSSIYWHRWQLNNGNV